MAWHLQAVLPTTRTGTVVTNRRSVTNVCRTVFSGVYH
jgi:hypothetical protein